MRFLQMRKIAEEIAGKQHRGLPLVPELRVTQVQTEPAVENENNN